MKFVLPTFFIQITLVFIISGTKGTDVIEYSDSNAITVIEHITSSSPVTIVEEKRVILKSLKENKSLAKRRRRKRRKKKRPDVNQNATIIPAFDVTVVAPTIYPNVTGQVMKSQRRKKFKKRRKGWTVNRKKNNITITTENISKSKPLLESKNLVLPVIPNQTLSPITQLITTTAKSIQRRKKQTRCSKSNGGCAHICLTKGLKKCQCFNGFTLANDRHSCIDINECLTSNGNCQMNCTNTIGSYHCQCPDGLRLSTDSKSCEDVNECLLRNGHGPCQDTCENTYGGYKCSCVHLKGTKLGTDLHNCADVDECAKDNGGCSHICINTFGRSFCSCPEGMELSSDFKKCQDVNECENESIKKSCPNGCLNMEGSYRCANISDLQNDESYQEVVCKPLFPPQNGYFKCSRKYALKTFTQSGRKRVKNSLGTKCVLKCPEGFKRRGQGFRVSCGYGGQWIGHMNSKCVPL